MKFSSQGSAEAQPTAYRIFCDKRDRSIAVAALKLERERAEAHLNRSVSVKDAKLLTSNVQLIEGWIEAFKKEESGDLILPRKDIDFLRQIIFTGYQKHVEAQYRLALGSKYAPVHRYSRILQEIGDFQAKMYDPRPAHQAEVYFPRFVSSTDATEDCLIAATS